MSAQVSEKQIEALAALAAKKKETVMHQPIKSHPTCPHLHPDRAWGNLGHLSERKKGCLAEMRAEIAQTEIDSVKFPHESNDQVCLRFLRARNFDVGAALDCMRGAIEWRKSFGMDRYKYMTTSQLLDGKIDRDTLVAQYPVGIKGHDRSGRPLFFKLYGRMNPGPVEECITAREAAKWETLNTEKMCYLFALNSAMLGYHVQESLVIIDLEHLSGYKVFSSYVRNVMKYCGEYIDDNYAESLGGCLVINAPWYVSGLWAVIKGFMHERTRSKFQILGSSYHEELHKRVDPDQLPVEYGGTGKLGFKSIDELFEGGKAMGVFATPEYRAMLAQDLPRTKLNLGEAEAAKAAALLEAAVHADSRHGGGGGGGAKANPKGAGYVKKKKKKK